MTYNTMYSVYKVDYRERPAPINTCQHFALFPQDLGMRGQLGPSGWFQAMTLRPQAVPSTSEYPVAPALNDALGELYNFSVLLFPRGRYRASPI